jgi:hypothetical protein
MIKFSLLLKLCLVFSCNTANANANANVALNNFPCVDGKYTLSPDGKLLYRLCKETSEPNTRYYAINPKGSQFSGEIVSTKDFIKVAPMFSTSDKVAWSLDGQAFYSATNYGRTWEILQQEVELLALEIPISNLNPSAVRTKSLINSNRTDGTFPVIDGLMSDLGFIPTIEAQTADIRKYILHEGKYYDYNDDSQTVISDKKTTSKKIKNAKVKVLKWINDPYGMPLLNLLYFSTKKMLSVNILEHSKWSMKFALLARHFSDFKRNIDEFDLYLTFAEKSIPNSQNKVWYISNEEHDTNALYEFDLEKGSHRLFITMQNLMFHGHSTREEGSF